MRAIAVLVLALLCVPVAGAWTWPVDGPVLVPFTFDSAHPYAGSQHRGVDIGAATGATVVAPAAGEVTFAGTVPTSGKSVSILTADALSVTLTHLGSLEVSKGALVADGAPVGTVGPSGTPELDVPYVHLGVRVAANDQAYLDPLGFLPPLAPAPASPAPAATPAPAPVPPVVEPAPAPPVTREPPAAVDPAPPPTPAPPVAVDPAAPAPAPVPQPEPPAAPEPAPEPPLVLVEPNLAPVAAAAPDLDRTPPHAVPVSTVEPTPIPAMPPAPLLLFGRRPVVAPSAGQPTSLRATRGREARPRHVVAHTRRRIDAPAFAPAAAIVSQPTAHPFPRALAVTAAAVLAALLVLARIIVSPSSSSEGVRTAREDPRRTGVAVWQRPAPHRPRGRLRRAGGRVRALPPAQGGRRADGQRDGRARDAGDGRRRPAGRVPA